MGVVNVTPDSFSDGGEWFEPDAGIRHGLDLLSEGADLVDVGGESTRPGARRPGPEEELRRVMPVVRGLVDAGALVSIDTMHACVARAALDAGAVIVNDVSGGLADPDMARTVAEARVPFVAMHWRGHSDHMDELARVVPVVRALAASGVACSVDTTRATVAAAAVEVGAVLVNDVSGGLADPRMLTTVADLGVPFVAMHWRGHSAGMQQLAVYDDVVQEVCDELGARLDACEKAGISEVLVDPGLGFAKQAEHNWALLQNLARLQALGPVLLGASRKRFLGELLDGREPKGRDSATTALTVLAAQAGVWGVRVHDAQGSADAVRVVERMRTWT
jgi:dihydropteroate synthase